MKLISFTVPCYNSEKYMKKCIDSLLVGGDDVEIIIIDDGSFDNTLMIANEYVKKYPNICRACHKENGGHGSGVNMGIEMATGLYFKVVDSDDYLQKEALLELIRTIKMHITNNEEADLYITNFIYDRQSDNSQYVSEYSNNFPVRSFFSWRDTKPLKLWKMLLMHSLLYKTEKLRESNTILPNHTFYVDNIYAYKPLPYMKKIFYLDVNLYMYYIGRADQSVVIGNMVKRYDQQIRVMNIMLSAYTYKEICNMDKKLKKQMLHILYAIMNNTIFFTTAKNSKERKELYYNMWNDLKKRDKRLYNYLKYHTSISIFNVISWRLKGFISTIGYKFLCKHIKLGM